MNIKLIPFIVLFSCLCLLCVNSADAQTWQSLNGPLESNISKIIVQADTIYVASQELAGFFKKQKDADQWIFVNVSISNGISEFEITDLNTMELGADGIFYTGHSGGPVTTSMGIEDYSYFNVSDDYGKSWKTMSSGLGFCSGGTFPGVNDIIISAKGSLIIDCGYSILKYSEDEEMFQETSGNPGVSSNPVFTFYEYEDTLAAGRVTGLEYSTDDGDSWTASTFDSLEVYSFEYMDNKWLVGTNAGLYSSNSINGTFDPINELSNVKVHALHKYENHIIVGTDSGAFRLKPDDLDVQAVFQGSYTGSIKAINSIEKTLLLGTENGLYECTIDGEDCNLTGVPNSRIRTINIQNEETLWVGSTTHVYRYFMETGQWDSSAIPISGTTLTGNIIPLNNNRFHSFGRDYFYTCSMENSLCDSTQVDPGNIIFDLKQNKAGDLFLASRERVFKSTDKGENWETIYTNPDNINFSLFTFSDSLLFINGGELIKYSLDNGTYDTLSNSIDVITNNGTIYSRVNGIQKSTDFGDTWTTILQSSEITNAGLGGLKTILFDEEEEKLYAITTMGGVFVSENEGELWGLSEEFSAAPVEATAISPNGTLYLGTRGAGVFTNTQPLTPPITISNEEEPEATVPDEFALHQNYPNPFNPSTTITYSLPEPSEIRLTVYNLVGQEVAVLQDGMQSRGVHTLQFDAGHFASGLYLYKLETENYSETRKMTLVK